jgi:RHS repeat-associated protein
VGGLWYFHHYDGQGNCMMLTAGTQPGTIQEQYDYDAFGFPYFYTAGGGKLLSPQRTRFLFTGREWLSELRIYDYRARQYQPDLGRFLQPDPKEFDAGDYNLYRYCHNDPINKSDPTGLDLVPDETTFAKAAAIGVAALIKYQVQAMLGTAPKDDKAVHQEVSKLMTEVGDPVSAIGIGLLQEMPPDADSINDLAADLKGVKDGIVSQLKNPLESGISKSQKVAAYLLSNKPDTDKEASKDEPKDLPGKDDDKTK